MGCGRASLSRTLMTKAQPAAPAAGETPRACGARRMLTADRRASREAVEWTDTAELFIWRYKRRIDDRGWSQHNEHIYSGKCSLNLPVECQSVSPTRRRTHKPIPSIHVPVRLRSRGVVSEFGFHYPTATRHPDAQGHCCPGQEANSCPQLLPANDTSGGSRNYTRDEPAQKTLFQEHTNPRFHR